MTTNFAYYGSQESSPKRLDDLLSYPKLISVDVETVSLEDRTPIGLAIATSSSDCYYFPIDSEVLPWNILRDPAVTKVFHNALFDLSSLYKYNIYIYNIEDTLTMAHLLNLPPKLIYLAAQVGVPFELTSVEKLLTKKQTMLDLPPETVAHKCCTDALATYIVRQKLQHLIPDWRYYLDEVALLPILVDMEKRGIPIDQEMREGLEQKYKKELYSYKKVAERMGFNPGSPKQVAMELSKRGYRLPLTKSNKSLSTDDESIRNIPDPIVPLVLKYRYLTKMLSTYIKPWAGASKAYTHFHVDTVTGRLGSYDRNMQNIPPDMRCIFLGPFTDMDYSQIELWVLAYMSQDSAMLKALERGIHQYISSTYNIVYRRAKNTVFSVVYGGSVGTVAETGGVSESVAMQIMRDLTTGSIRKWFTAQQKYAKENGYVKTILGRKLYIPLQDISSGEYRTKATNYPIQGTAAEIIKRAMLRCKDLPMLLQVHDELLFSGDVTGALSGLGLDNIVSFPTPYKSKLLTRWE